jgi:23S rRNA (cytidine1920-2'-O)/16S rRNA (cytidine1409-2'-O)-methyltransferase
VARRVRLVDELLRVRPGLSDARSAIYAGRVRVNGSVISNPDSRVERGASIVVVGEQELRGAEKLRAAIDVFAVDVKEKTCIDIGAAAGGFTKVLLERGARKVYAVDAGHGQLLGSLRQDQRVVNLESTNVAELDQQKVPEQIDLVTVDVSYLSLSDAVGQMEVLRFGRGAELIGLVKPMFELRLPQAPSDQETLAKAVESASRGVAASEWMVVDRMESGVGGAKGAIEGFVYARRGLTT